MEGGGERKPREEEEGKAVNGSARDEEGWRLVRTWSQILYKKEKKEKKESQDII